MPRATPEPTEAAADLERAALRDYERAIAVAGLEIENLSRSIERKREAGENTFVDEQMLDRMLQTQAERIATRIEVIAKGGSR